MRSDVDAVGERTDAHGLSPRVYHATYEAFDQFDIAHAGKHTDADSAKCGFFFTSDPIEAHGYIGTADGANIRPAQISYEKPLDLPFSEHGLPPGVANEAGLTALIMRAFDGGYDALILRDMGAMKGRDLYVAFDAEQITPSFGPVSEGRLQADTFQSPDWFALDAELRHAGLRHAFGAAPEWVRHEALQAAVAALERGDDVDVAPIFDAFIRQAAAMGL